MTREEMKAKLDRLIRKHGNHERSMSFGDDNRKAREAELDSLAAAIADLREQLGLVEKET
jgi:hypothetical protein